MTYDQWKTTDPRDYEPEEEDPASELEQVCEDLRDTQEALRRHREALLNLYTLVKAIYCGPIHANLAQMMREHQACRAAADVLCTDRLDDPKF
jgi:hypothetical protein